VLLDESPSVTTSNSILNNAHAHYNKAAIALACIFAAGFMVSIAALVTTVTVVITCYRKRVSRSVSVVKRDSTPELATPVATDLDLEIPIYENNEIVMESSLEHINTGENIAYNCVVNA
jgi:hypothetical protein